MHITCHTQLVLCPTINDGEQLDRSIRDLAALRPIVESISVVPVGLTKYNNMIKTGELPPLRHYTRQEAEAIIEQVEVHQRRFAGEDPDRYPFVYLSDEWYFITGHEFPPSPALRLLCTDRERRGYDTLSHRAMEPQQAQTSRRYASRSAA